MRLQKLDQDRWDLEEQESWEKPSTEARPRCRYESRYHSRAGCGRPSDRATQVGACRWAAAGFTTDIVGG